MIVASLTADREIAIKTRRTEIVLSKLDAVDLCAGIMQLIVQDARTPPPEAKKGTAQ